MLDLKKIESDIRCPVWRRLEGGRYEVEVPPEGAMISTAPDLMDDSACVISRANDFGKNPQSADNRPGQSADNSNNGGQSKADGAEQKSGEDDKGSGKMTTETYQGEDYQRIKFNEIEIGMRLFYASSTGPKFQSYGTVVDIQDTVTTSGVAIKKIVLGNGRVMKKGDFTKIWRQV